MTITPLLPGALSPLPVSVGSANVQAFIHSGIRSVLAKAPQFVRSPRPLAVLAALTIFAFGLQSTSQAQYLWTGATSSDPSVAGNWASSYVPTIGGTNNEGLRTSSTVPLNYAINTITTFGVAAGNPGTSLIGQVASSTWNVTAGTLNFNGSWVNEGGTVSIWIGNGSFFTSNLTINGGAVQVANGTILGRDQATGILSISNGSFTTGGLSASVGTYVGAPFGSAAGVGRITIGNAGRFTLLGAAADPLVFGGNFVAGVANSSSSYVNFTTASTGSLVLNLSSATLGANYFNSLITNGYVRINGTVNTNPASYSINTSNLSAAILGLSGMRTFVHPGISHHQTDLDRLKNNVTVEPYATAYANFSGQGYSSYNNTGQGPLPSVTYGAGNGQFEIRNDAQVARQNAIMWYITGNTAYRTNAINIMNGWANTMRSFDQTDILTAGTAIFDFCNAAEIIRSTGNGAWTPAQIAAFQNWMITYMYPPLLAPGNSIAANQLSGAGFGGLQIKGLLALGIFAERPDFYSFGVSSYLHNGTYSYGFLEYISPSGQNYENQRDVGHPSGNLGSFMESGYVIWNQGQDVLSTSSNLLAKAFESQAKFDLGWDVAPIPYTAPDGGYHNKMNGEGRTPYDNLRSNLAYWFFHDFKGLEMPYTKLSADYKFPDSNNDSFYYRRDTSGEVPLKPLIGEPAPTGVRLYEDGFSGSYMTNFQPGNYTNAALRSGGLPANTVSSIKVPIGWTVTAYSGDNYTGSSIVLTGTVQNRGEFILYTFNDLLVSMKVVGSAASTYPIFPTTYRLVARHSGKVAEVAGASTANGANVDQITYTSAANQLWRVEDMGNSKFRLLNMRSNKAMEVAGASLVNGGLAGAAGNVDQSAYLSPINVALSGTASANAGSAPEVVFDGNVNTKWGTNIPAWIQTQLPAGKVIVQYTVSSANDVPERDPAAWQLQGSNNGSTWTTLDSQTGQSFANRFETKSFTFTNTTSYTYYRLNITAVASGTFTQMSELALYEVPPGAHQRWTITPASGAAYGGYMKFLNVNSGKALDVYNSLTTDGTNIRQNTDNAANNQQWSLLVP